MKNLLLTIALVSVALTSQSQLRVSDNHRYLVTADGKPFFWLGDTAWELFHRLTREETEKYLRDRAEKRFTVIQAVVLAEMDGLQTPNAYGEVPLEDNDPTRPREAYFQHVDFVVDLAGRLGLYIAMLPTWGDKVYKDRWGIGPEIFNPENARAYGKWIGNRYKDKENIVWVLGGDRNPRNERDVSIWRALAEGIADGTGGNNRTIMTFHPQPTALEDGGSSKWFHNDAWLDFNMFQTGHCRENNVWDRIRVAYDKVPMKPVLDGETIYEDHPVCFNARDLGYSSAYDVRKNAYFSVFAGSFGHTYGCHDIWQMYAPHRKPVNGPLNYWYVALDLPGATQMQHLRNLIESRPMLERVPDQGIIADALGTSDHIQATRGNDYLFVYSAQGTAFTADLTRIKGEQFIGYWYNPRTGEPTDAGRFSKKKAVKFTPPTQGYGQDWVLIVDNAAAGFEKPVAN